MTIHLGAHPVLPMLSDRLLTLKRSVAFRELRDAKCKTTLAVRESDP